MAKGIGGPDHGRGPPEGPSAVRSLNGDSRARILGGEPSHSSLGWGWEQGGLPDREQWDWTPWPPRAPRRAAASSRAEPRKSHTPQVCLGPKQTGNARRSPSQGHRGQGPRGSQHCWPWAGPSPPGASPPPVPRRGQRAELPSWGCAPRKRRFLSVKWETGPWPCRGYPRRDSQRPSSGNTPGPGPWPPPVPQSPSLCKRRGPAWLHQDACLQGSVDRDGVARGVAQARGLECVTLSPGRKHRASQGGRWGRTPPLWSLRNVLMGARVGH